jgi:hypothetical protein
MAHSTEEMLQKLLTLPLWLAETMVSKVLSFSLWGIFLVLFFALLAIAGIFALYLWLWPKIFPAIFPAKGAQDETHQVKKEQGR